MSDTGTLVLESSSSPGAARQAARRLTAETYRHPLPFYCKKYGKKADGAGAFKPLDRKTVSSWIRRGREAEAGPDLPPLDSPECMADWWERNMKQEVPDVLLAFRLSSIKEAAPGVREDEKQVAGAQSAPVVSPEEIRSAMRQALVRAEAAGLGFEAAVARARSYEREAGARYAEALSKPELFSLSEVDKRQKAWENAFNALSKAEKDEEAQKERSKDWARWDEVESVAGECLGVLHAGLRSIIVRIATKLGLPEGWFDKLNSAYQKELDAVLRSLGEGGYAPLLELE